MTIIRRATLKIQLPISCSHCGAEGVSEVITIESQDIDLDTLCRNLRRYPLGTHFPVGWAKFYGNPVDILSCPTCVASRQ